VLIDWLEELAYDQRDRLDPLHLLLRADKLALEVLLLVLDVFLLELEELEMPL
jgi:hypothetical protein